MDKNNFKMLIIGRRLRNLRQSMALSRPEIEKRHGISSNSLKAWENGITEIGTVKLMIYLKVINQYYYFAISIDDLLDSKENYLDNINTQKPVSSFDEKTINQRALLPDKIYNDMGLISNMFKRDMDSLLTEGDTLIRSLINNIPFQMAFKDENNAFILVNNLTAATLGGTPDDFAGKNLYDLFPDMAKKYHDDDLKALSTNTRLSNYTEIVPIKDNPILLNMSKTPIIHQETNKKIILAIAHTIN